MAEIVNFELAEIGRNHVIAFFGNKDFLEECVAKAQENSGLPIDERKFFVKEPSVPSGYERWLFSKAHLAQKHPRIKLEEAAKAGHFIQSMVEVTRQQNVIQGSALRINTFENRPTEQLIELELDAPGVEGIEAIRAVSKGIAGAVSPFASSKDVLDITNSHGLIKRRANYDSAGISFRLGSFARLKADAEWYPSSPVINLKSKHIQFPDQGLACIAIGLLIAEAKDVLIHRDVA